MAKRIGLAVAALLTAAGCQQAEEKQAAADAKAAGFTPPSVTSRLDWGSRGERLFHRLDRDSDDVLTPNEIPRPDSRLLEYDRDKDGDVSLVEFTEGTMERFDRMDLNRDGTVTSEERQTAERTGAVSRPRPAASTAPAASATPSAPSAPAR